MLPGEDQIQPAKKLVDVGDVLANVEPMGDIGDGEAERSRP